MYLMAAQTTAIDSATSAFLSLSEEVRYYKLL